MNERNRQTRREQSERHNEPVRKHNRKAKPYRRPAQCVADYLERLNEGYGDDSTT